MLIQCPECGKEISDKAKNCPNCGFPMSELGDSKETIPKPDEVAQPKEEKQPVRTKTEQDWTSSFPKNSFIGISPDGVSRPTMLRCGNCNWESPAPFDALDFANGKCRIKKNGKCAKCGRLYSVGDVFSVRARNGSPAFSPKYNPSRSYYPPTSKAIPKPAPQSYQNAYSGEYKKSRTGRGWKTVVLVVLVLFVIAVKLNQCNSSSSGRKPASSSYTSSYSSKPSQPSTQDFGDEAEKVVKNIKEAMSPNTVTWYANGYELSVTVKVKEISGDDLADFYAADAAGAQDLVNQLNDSMKNANKSTVDHFKTLGYTQCHITFRVVTSDDLEICTVENGKTTHSVTKDNFKYG